MAEHDTGGKSVISRRLRRLERCLWLLLAGLLILTAGCAAGQPEQAWLGLPELAQDPAAAGLQPLWESNANADQPAVLVFIEPFCRSKRCVEFHTQVLPELVEAEDLHLVVYDYPLSQSSRAFMLSAVGACVLTQQPEQFLPFLSGAAQISDRYDNNLEIQLLARELSQKYDRACVGEQTRRITALFENHNPLELEEVPAVSVGGRLASGELSAAAIRAWVEASQQR